MNRPHQRKGARKKKPRQDRERPSPPNHAKNRDRNRNAPMREGEPHLTKSMRAMILQAKEETTKALQTWHDEAKSLQAKGFPSPPSSMANQLDAWQQEAYDGLRLGQNIVVDAPTTAGKTRVVEAFFQANVQNPDFRAAYTTPVKSLSNDKLREFRTMFGRENVGIATGDIKENLNAPIVVTTLETYRNSLLGVEPDLGRKLVIFDEYHFMQDGSRGSAWEEAIILTPPDCQLLLLSASVANGEEFVAWLEKIHGGATRLIRTSHRPVPLSNLVYFKDEWLLADLLPEKVLRKKHKTDPLPLPHKHLAPRLAKLVPLGLTPCIVYVGRRKSAESIAFELSQVLQPLPETQRREIGELLMAEDKETGALKFIDHKLRRLMQTYGIAYHHSGMAPPARMAVESILKHGKLNFCSATMGLSIGINFSVRSSLISDYQRPGEGGFSKYDASEVLQMLGRAGRRGRDVVGYSLWPSTESYAHLAKATRDRCDSRLKNDPTTFLSLISQGMNLKQIEQFYGRSFMRFKDSGIDLGLVRKSRILQKLGEKALPCQSPAHEFAKFQAQQGDESICRKCRFQTPCHRYINTKANNDLAALHIHLHVIGALDHQDKLTSFGEVAKYFPQAGGLLIAKYVHDHPDQEDLVDLAELMACVVLARFKEPTIDERYELPFDEGELEEALEDYYPIELFPELYDPPYGRRDYPVLREFNPRAGFVIKAWLQGMPWNELQRLITTEKFAQGDLMSLIYRVASYMQSLAQSKAGRVSIYAGGIREELLREPLTVTL